MKLRIIGTLVLAATTLIFSCSKKDYYEDTGTLNPEYNGTVMQYLESKPEYFDSLVRIIKMADYETVLNQENITFFAPTDSSIRAAMEIANDYRERVGKPRLYKISDVAPSIWKKYLGRYIFEFARGLNDFSQIDFANITSYPGQMYTSYSGEQMNIGSVYTDLVNKNEATGTTTTIKYGGYRFLTISYLTSPFSPTEYDTWRSAVVSSVNIKPKNGYVHVLSMLLHVFGFDENEFSQDVAYYND
ncbi:hypothetical protein [Niabella terrae]